MRRFGISPLLLGPPLLVLLASCAHLPARPAPDAAPDLARIEDETRAALLATLQARADVAEVREVKVSDVRSNADGSIGLAYRLVYASDSPPSGRVSHLVEATALLEPAGEPGRWQLTRAEPRQSTLVFETPVTIAAEPADRRVPADQGQGSTGSAGSPTQ
jgi:hypothetical protein